MLHSLPTRATRPPGATPSTSRARWSAVALTLALLLAACSSSSGGTGQTETGGVTTMTIGAPLPGGPATSSASPAATTPTDRTPPSATTATAPQPPACLSPAWVRALPLRARLGQLLAVEPSTPPTLQTVNALALQGIGGFIIGTGQESVGSPQLLEIKSPHGLPLWVATDEEGGGVARFTSIAPALPWPRDLAAKSTPATIEQLVAAHAQQLRARGVTVDFAPVVDVADANYKMASIGQRSFSNNPSVVTDDARAFANGLHAANVMATLKHFPGHGRASGDTHKQAATTPPLTALTTDLQPYRDLLTGPQALPLDTTAVMVGHLDVPGLTDGGLPTSLNPKAYELLRNQIGFQGVVFTDELGGMKAIADRVGLPEAVRLAITAGADVAIWVDAGQTGAALDGLEKAVADKTLTEDRVDQSVTRVLRAKKALGLPVC